MMNGKQKLTRPRNGRMLSGVCAGLADFFFFFLSLVRIIYVFATVFTAFAGILIYIILLIIIPEEPNRYYQHD